MPEESVFYHRAQVVLPDEARLSAIRKLVGNRFSDEEIYPWDAEISNDLLDSHYTHMSESTLTNYVEDARNGVAFLRGHNWHELPIGYSVDAEMGKEKKRQRVMAGFYTVRGIADTDDLIKRMDAKLLRDVSVGFHGGRMVCDLCGQDFWDCRHFPGLKYEEKEGDTVRTQLATFTIEDARLSEVSGVFDGSTPQAMIRKAQLHAASGLLQPKQIEVLEQRYRTRLPVKRSFVFDHDRMFMPLEYEVKMAMERKAKETREMEGLNEEQVARVKESLSRSGFFTETDWEKIDAEGLVRDVAKLANHYRSVESQAKDGVQYRSDLIAAAHIEGVRANGNDYDKEGYEKILATAPLETIKRFTKDWEKVASAKLPSGRQSEDVAQQVPVAEIIPDEAYA